MGVGEWLGWQTRAQRWSPEQGAALRLGEDSPSLALPRPASPLCPPLLFAHCTRGAWERGLALQLREGRELLYRKELAGLGGPRGVPQERELVGNLTSLEKHLKIPYDLEGARFHPNSLMSRLDPSWLFIGVLLNSS